MKNRYAEIVLKVYGCGDCIYYRYHEQINHHYCLLTDKWFVLPKGAKYPSTCTLPFMTDKERNQ